MYVLDCDDHLLVRLERGEKLMASLGRLMAENEWSHFAMGAIGAVEDIELGAWSIEDKEYTRKRFEGAYELASLQGTGGWDGEDPRLHAHVVISGHDFLAHAGHLFECTVYATVEVVVWPGMQYLEREPDEAIGLSLWKLPEHCEGIR